MASRGDFQRGPLPDRRAVPEEGLEGLSRGPAADPQMAGPVRPGEVHDGSRASDFNGQLTMLDRAGERAASSASDDSGSEFGSSGPSPREKKPAHGRRAAARGDMDDEIPFDGPPRPRRPARGGIQGIAKAQRALRPPGPRAGNARDGDRSLRPDWLGLPGAPASRRTCADRRRPSVAEARRRFPYALWVEADFARLTSAEAWRPLLEGIDAVVNCAGVLQDGARDDTRSFMSRRPARCSTPVRRRASAASSISRRSAPSAQARPRFSRTKAQSEAYLAQLDLDGVILRPALVLAPAAYGGTAMLRGLAGLPWVDSADRPGKPHPGREHRGCGRHRRLLPCHPRAREGERGSSRIRSRTARRDRRRDAALARISAATHARPAARCRAGGHPGAPMRWAGSVGAAPPARPRSPSSPMA